MKLTALARMTIYEWWLSNSSELPKPGTSTHNDLECLIRLVHAALILVDKEARGKYYVSDATDRD